MDYKAETPFKLTTLATFLLAALAIKAGLYALYSRACA